MVHTQRAYNRRLLVVTVRPDLSLTSFWRAKLFCITSERLKGAVVLSLR